ncbi:MAG TPA: hypothetical protein PLJ44_09580 [Victivallales bacterium]|nr:hypothetical protein [Victivallales bacterium]
MKSIFWDLDGVLRDLSGSVFKNKPNSWNYKENNENIFDKVRKDYSILINAKPTPYLKIALSFPFIKILTCQPDDWKPFTEKWVEKHLSRIAYEIIYTLNQEQKLTIIKSFDAYLIDDCPQFSDYSRIVLIDAPYNRHIKCKIRVKSPNELKTILKREVYKHA